MRTILDPEKGVIRLLGRQKTKTDKAYRFSNYCLSIPCEEGTILYHTMTGEMAILSSGETIKENWEKLVSAWFLVPTEFDEKEQVDDFRRVAKLVQSGRKKTGFTIVTTTDCNARCFYCYEKGIRRLTMTPELAKDAARYIAKQCEGERVNLKWFGGEPLLNTAAISALCSELDNLGVRYDSVTTTNGYFLDANLCLEAKERWNLKAAQITIDGTEKVYNQTKAYIQNEESAYLRVLDNIEACLDTDIHITIRLNMYRENTEDLIVLCKELVDRFKGKKNLCIRVVNLKNSSGKGYLLDDETKVKQYYLAINEIIVQSGLEPKERFVRGIAIHQCMADDDSCEVIYPDGRLGKCENYNESEIIGNIYTENRDEAIANSWKEYYAFRECTDCCLYPFCMKIKKCFWQENRCSEYERWKKKDRLIRQVVNEYYREKTEKK